MEKTGNYFRDNFFLFFMFRYFGRSTTMLTIYTKKEIEITLNIIGKSYNKSIIVLPPPQNITSLKINKEEWMLRSHSISVCAF